MGETSLVWGGRFFLFFCLAFWRFWGEGDVVRPPLWLPLGAVRGQEMSITVKSRRCL